MSHFFSKLNKPFSLLWNDGPRLRAIHTELEDMQLAPTELGRDEMFGIVLDLPIRAVRLKP